MVAPGLAFCTECGTPVTRDGRGPVAAQEERRTVSVLFVDLIGFTGVAERLDPEDLHQLQMAYFSTASAAIRRYGGIVEKYIGDAVMAVFGVPVETEHDAHRAVIAGLELQQVLDDAPLAGRYRMRARVGVATGEALVDLGAVRQAGEALVSGDVVATAARLQQHAPTGGVVVSAATRRATYGTIRYGDAPLRMSLPGKSGPVEAWLAREPIRHAASLDDEVTPLVGRVHELDLLAAALSSCVREREARLVSVVGGHGLGKSRLVRELCRRVASTSELAVRWRVGRCLPYGESSTFGPLAEIVKAEASVLDSDDPATTRNRLAEALSRVLPDGTAARLLELIGPLAGLPGRQASAGETQAAWRQVLLAMAEQVPTVLVLEDLHFADPALPRFVADLVGAASGVPLFILCTYRPELLADQPTWSASLPDTLTVSLGTLRGAKLRTLISALLRRHGLLDTLADRLAEITHGNPMYAVEYVHMLAERAAGEEIDPDAQLAIPESVHGVIANRIDLLGRDERTVLHAAAVLGEGIWPAAITAMVDMNELEVARILGRLVRRDMLTAAGSPAAAGAAATGSPATGAAAAAGASPAGATAGAATGAAAGAAITGLPPNGGAITRPVPVGAAATQLGVAGDGELVFRHVLLRDVAYGRLPRAARATLHRLAAGWLEQVSVEGRHDSIGAVARHRVAALQLAQSLGEDTSTDAREARRALYSAAMAAYATYAVAPALAWIEQALDLWPVDEDADRRRECELLRCRLAFLADGEQFFRDGGAKDLARLVERMREAGDAAGEARAETLLGQAEVIRAERLRALEHLRRAVELYESLPDDAAKVEAYGELARLHMVEFEWTHARPAARRARELAERLGLADAAAGAAVTDASARYISGDRGGLEELERCVLRCREQHLPTLRRAAANLAVACQEEGDLARAAALQAESVTAEGAQVSPVLGHSEEAELAWFTGDWLTLLRAAHEYLDVGDTETTEWDLQLRGRRACLRLLCDEPAGEELRRCLSSARQSGFPRLLLAACGYAALGQALAGDAASAAALLAELAAVWRGARNGVPMEWLSALAHTSVLIAAVDPAVADTAVEVVDSTLIPTRWVVAAQAVVAGARAVAEGLHDAAGAHFVEAVRRYDEIGCASDAVLSATWAARELVAAGALAAAEPHLARVRAFAERNRAPGLIRLLG